MRTALVPRRPLQLAAIAGLAAALAGCYVVPMHPPPPAHVLVPGAMPTAAAPLRLTARLYPANALASSYGMVAATVPNDLNGRGHFSTVIDGESFTGEATRLPGASREGMASGAGTRGSYLNCRYTMNSPTLGTGSRSLSGGAMFSMHIGGY